MQVYSVCTCMFMYTVQKFAHAHTVYCMWLCGLCVQIISICVCSMYKSVCYIGSWLQPNARWSTVYQFFWHIMLQNSFREEIFLQTTHMDKRKVWHSRTFTFQDKAEKREIHENISPPKKQYMVYDFDIPEEHLSMG